MGAKWVFSKNSDLLVFSGPIIVALALNVISFDVALPWDLIFVGAYFLLNLPHGFITYWHGYGYQATRKQHFTWLVFIPVFFFSLCTTLYALGGRGYLQVFFAHFSAWHFLKQQQAWFFLSQEPASERLRLFRKNAIFAVTFGTFLASISGDKYLPWVREGDLAPIPQWAFLPLISWVICSSIAYVVVEFILWKKNGKTNWAAHHTWLAAAVIWYMVRLGPQHPGSNVLMTMSHVIPYFFVSFRYVKSKHVGGSLRSTLLCSGLYLACFVIGLVDGHLRMFVPEERDIFGPIIVFSTTFVFSHFTFDMFLWKRKHNPEWVRALGPSPTTEDVPKENSTQIAA